MQNPKIAEIGARYGVGVRRLAARYLLQLGLLLLPKTATPAHMRSNADVDFAISDADMAALATIDPIAGYGEADHFPVYAKTDGRA